MMSFELNLSVGDVAAIITVGGMLFGFQWRMSSIFNRFCTEMKLFRQDLNNYLDRLKSIEAKVF